ncbi:CrcB family protein [Deinococcus sp.]|uniref:fluoride efflux transporter FluC n=1 Tax=Deinococcus sp. TaxID=47478 RepID=UPI0025D44DA0|nr:CrcB family protein [Deinococcus sp.]
MTFQAALLVALGGAAGALSRYGLSLWTTALGARHSWAASLTTLPIATLLINVSGSFALGLLVGLVGRGLWPAELRLALGVGFLGAFTTFSAFSVDLDTLMVRGEWGRAALVLFGNVGLGIVAAAAGRMLALR